MRSTALSTARTDVFLDTSGLYALVDRRDHHHVAARIAVERHLRTGGRLVLSDAIISESVTLATARGGTAVALRILELTEQSAGLHVEWIDEARFAATKAFFRKHADHGYSFADCSSFVLMRELGLRQALTSDRHYTQAGYVALLSRA